MHYDAMRMISDGEVPNTEVVRIFETYNIAFGVIFIRGSMQPIELQQRPADLTCHVPDSDLKVNMGPESRQNGLVLRIGMRWLIRLVKTDKFDVCLVSIRVSVRLLYPRQGAGQEGAANPGRSPA